MELVQQRPTVYISCGDVREGTFVNGLGLSPVVLVEHAEAELNEGLHNEPDQPRLPTAAAP